MGKTGEHVKAEQVLRDLFVGSVLSFWKKVNDAP